MLRYLALFLAFATPTRADVAAALDQHIFPGYAAFERTTKALDSAAQADCTPDALRPAYNLAFDTWVGVGHLRLGPAEVDGRSLAIEFWPDPKSLGQKAQMAMITGQDKAAQDPIAFAQVSVAARGFLALERLLYAPEPLGDADYVCALVRATSADLAKNASAIYGEWLSGFSVALLTAGEAGNTRFLTPIEARQALYTALITGFEFAADQRVGRPLGTFDKPRPERAEARLSSRSLRNVTLSLTALQQFAQALAPDTPLTDAAFLRAFDVAAKIKDPVFSDVADPQGWLRAEILQQAIRATRDAAMLEIGPALNVGVGFNAADGD